MPNTQIENLEKSQIKMTFTVTADEVRLFLEAAAKRMSEQSPIPGFRPGHADYGTVKTRFGEMKIYEEAIESIIRKFYVEAVLSNNLETVGSPNINVEKLAPGNDIVFTIVVNRMPAIKSLPDYKKMSVKSHSSKVEDSEVELALKDLQRMQTKEARAPKDSKVGLNDKVVISMNMKLDGVPVEGGQSPNHAVYLSEDYYIPGFKDHLISLKEEDEKTFSLPFPKEHPQKMLAGKNVEFLVKLNELYNLALPNIDDEFAKNFGMKDLGNLKTVIKTNLLTEKEREDRAKEEKEMLELLAWKTQFEDIPDILVNEEINKMITELTRAVENQELNFDTYLKNLNKTLAELKIDFTPQALIRIKVALAIRKVADEEKIEVSDEELNEEIDKIAEHYEEKKTKDQISSPEYRDYTEQILRNRKVIAFLRSIMIK